MTLPALAFQEKVLLFQTSDKKRYSLHDIKRNSS